MIKPIIPIAAISVATWALGLATAGEASAHAMLTSARPGVGSTISASPSAIDLTFTEGVVPQFCGVSLTTAAGGLVKTGRPSHDGGDATLEVPIAAPLAPGTYTVTWHAVSVDTHRTQGRFTFTLAR